MRSAAFLLVALFATRAHATLNQPASWYGIVPGVSKEPNVIALYGLGYFRDTLGDTGSRTYIIRNGGGTLTFVFGFDKEVDSIKWEAGTRADIPRAMRLRITIDAMPKRWLGWSPARAAGATIAKIKEWFGEPTRVTSEGAWNYDAFEASRDAAELTLHFKDGVVIRADYDAPAGE